LSSSRTEQIATIMAFGAGVLMAVLSVLMEDDWHAGGFVAAA
jgi:hypothetical protein